MLQQETTQYRTAVVEGLSRLLPRSRGSGEAQAAPPRWVPRLLASIPQPDPGSGRPLQVLSPDYPGFGNTDMPEDFEYTFDRLSEIRADLLQQTGFRPFGLYM